MARVFQIKRGLKANLPTLAQGEFAMTTDSGAEDLWLGSGSGNLRIPLRPTAADVGALARDGSNAMTGALKLQKTASNPDGAVARLSTEEGVLFGAQADVEKNTSNRALIKLRHSQETAAAALQLLYGKDGKTSTYDVLHTGNKPSGSYTGNGSAAERTVHTGGTGDCLLLYTKTNYFGFVTPNGGILWHKSTGEAIVFDTTKLKYEAGVLTMALSTIPNSNSSPYYYRCL